MARKPRKNSAAVSLAKKRWAKVTKAERSTLMKAAIKVRWDRYRKRQEKEAKQQAAA